MRIGILTLPLHTNYGGILQAYALQTVLERMGHDVCVIGKEWRPLRLPLWKAPLLYGKRIVRNIGGHRIPVFYERKYNRERPLISRNTDRFVSGHIHKKIYAGYSSVGRDDFDAIIVGSDQVWRPKYFGGIEDAYLKFAEGWDIRRIAYAASFGTDVWEYTPSQTAECGRLLRQFDAVSVRESAAVGMCRERFGVEARHVLDPTMLLTASDYMRVSGECGASGSGGTLLNYILDETPEKKALVESIAREKGLVPFRVNSRVEDINAPVSERIQPPVEQWLRGFHDAEFVVTDSFHACVFSILFHKPFAVYGNARRGMARFMSLLGMLGLEERMTTDGRGACVGGIDFCDVDRRLSDLRRMSEDFLLSALARKSER